MTQLRHALTNLQQLVAELSTSLWDKATDQERRFPTEHLPLVVEEPPPVVPEADQATTNYTTAYIDNKHGILDVEGYVPKETILDTGATKVMLSQTFAAAMRINFNNLNCGVEYITASGAIEMPLGISRGKVKFTFARGTPHMFTTWLLVAIVDTTTHDVLLGMEFMTGVGGAHDMYIEIFKCRWWPPHRHTCYCILSQLRHVHLECN